MRTQVDGGVLLSASKDESIRLWNVRTNVCVAIFAGDGGHRDEVISIDIRASGAWIQTAAEAILVTLWHAWPAVCSLTPTCISMHENGHHDFEWSATHAC
jgi:WD40 repeat protein